MNRSAESLRKRKIVFSAVAEAAEKGERCPDSNKLAALSGYRPSVFTEVFRRLAADGLITCVSRGNLRVVTIIATGKTTADYTLPDERFVPAVRPKLTVGEILTLTERVFNISRRDILSPARFRHIVRSRQAVCITAARHGWGVSHIGRALGRDHTTICHARNIATALERSEPAFAARLAALDAAVQQKCAA